jgi:hypothetical protein
LDVLWDSATSPQQIVFAQEFPECPAVLFRSPRGLGDIAIVGSEDRFKKFVFESFDDLRLHRLKRPVLCCVVFVRQIEIEHLNHGMIRQEKSPGEHVLKFPDVPWPRIGEHAVKRGERETLGRLVRERCLLVQKVPNEQGNIGTPFSEGRKSELKTFRRWNKSSRNFPS